MRPYTRMRACAREGLIITCSYSYSTRHYQLSVDIYRSSLGAYERMTSQLGVS